MKMLIARVIRVVGLAAAAGIFVVFAVALWPLTVGLLAVGAFAWACATLSPGGGGGDNNGFD